MMINQLDAEMESNDSTKNDPVPSGGHESAQPCGCDPGAKWICQWHLIERRIEEQQEHG